MALGRRGWMSAGGIFLLFGLSALLLSAVAGDQEWGLHGAWCVVGSAIALWMLVKGLRRGFDYVLRDHLVMFTGAFALYFLVGASLLAFGSAQQISNTISYYSLDVPSSLRADAMNGIGFGIALMTAALSPRRWFYYQTDRIARLACKMSYLKALLLMMALGMCGMYISIKSDLNPLDGPISGIWRALANFVFVAIYLGSSYRGRYHWLMSVVATVMAAALVIFGLLLFNKTLMLLAIGALAAGLSIRYRTWKIVPAGLALVVVLFLSVGGVVVYGRNVVGTKGYVGLAQRWEIMERGVFGSGSYSAVGDYNSWGRFCYVPEQVTAMDFYDLGNGGRELELIPWLFVPRVLFPNKPVITRTGQEFYKKITRNTGSSTGQGIFSSGYYNAGWPGVVLVSIICGWLLAQTSTIANAIFARGAVLLLPFALLGVYMAFRIDGDFVADYLGMFVFLLYPILLFSGLHALQNRRV